jgi:hypothetical protein
MPRDLGASFLSWWYESASAGVGRVKTDKWESSAAEREVTREAEEPRPVLLVLLIAFGSGEKGERVVLVYLSADFEARQLSVFVRLCEKTYLVGL